jgi:hypothetical protein
MQPRPSLRPNKTAKELSIGVIAPQSPIRSRHVFGLEYMYKAGYDPTAFVDFFEKIETLEKRKPGTMAKVFSTHPMTDDRIKSAQKNIQEILVAKPE